MRAHIVKEILLGISGVGAEVGFGEALKALAGGAAAREVKLAQGFHDPDVYGKGGLKSIGKEKDAIGDLGADAGELDEFGAGGGNGEGMEFGEAQFFGGDGAGGSEEIRGAEAHFAISQFGFGDVRADAWAVGKDQAGWWPAGMAMGSPKRSQSSAMIWRIWTICLVEERMNEARHSHGSWRKRRRPWQASTAERMEGSSGKLASTGSKSNSTCK